MQKEGRGVGAENPQSKSVSYIVHSLELACGTCVLAVSMPDNTCIVGSGVDQGQHQLFALA